MTVEEPKHVAPHLIPGSFSEERMVVLVDAIGACVFPHSVMEAYEVTKAGYAEVKTSFAAAFSGLPTSGVLTITEAGMAFLAAYKERQSAGAKDGAEAEGGEGDTGGKPEQTCRHIVTRREDLYLFCTACGAEFDQ